MTAWRAFYVAFWVLVAVFLWWLAIKSEPYLGEVGPPLGSVGLLIFLGFSTWVLAFIFQEAVEQWGFRWGFWVLAAVLLWWFAFKSEPVLGAWGPVVGAFGFFYWFLFAAFGGVSKHRTFRVALWVGTLIFFLWLAFLSGPVWGRTAVVLGRWGLGIWLFLGVCRVGDVVFRSEARAKEEERERVEKGEGGGEGEGQA